MSAIISECGKYRYRLERGTGRSMAFIMVNPSTADAETDDATIRKCIGFAHRNGYSRIIVGNKFAWRATDVKELRSAADAIGADNHIHLAQIIRDADILVAAWGALSKLPEALQGRWKTVVKMTDSAGKQLHCFGTVGDGHPRHPLMTGYNEPLTPWQVPWFAGRNVSDGAIYAAVSQASMTPQERADLDGYLDKTLNTPESALQSREATHG